MGIEHVSIFSARVAPDVALQEILRAVPSAKVTKAGGTWSNIDVEFSRSLMRKNLRLNVSHDPEYYGPEQWPKQHLGMIGYFSNFPAGERELPLIQTLASFRFALASTFEPELRPDGDPRFDLLCDVAHAIDGCLMIPGGLLDSLARPLIYADGEFDPEAVFPPVPEGQEPPPYLVAAFQGGDDEDEDVEPPTPQRVAARTLVTAAVVGRGLLEMQLQQGHAEVAENLPRIVEWIRELGLESECEPEEWQRLNTPAGELAEQAMIDSMWRIEGLAVLAWSLGLIDQPPYDELVDSEHLLPATFFLDEANGRALPLFRPRACVLRASSRSRAIKCWPCTGDCAISQSCRAPSTSKNLAKIAGSAPSRSAGRASSRATWPSAAYRCRR